MASTELDYAIKKSANDLAKELEVRSVPHPFDDVPVDIAKVSILHRSSAS